MIKWPLQNGTICNFTWFIAIQYVCFGLRVCVHGYLFCVFVCLCVRQLFAYVFVWVCAHWCMCMFSRVCVCMYSTHAGIDPGKSGPECKHCKADPDSECRFCSCCVCGGKQDAHMQLLCDECNMAFHIYCLNPPLSTIPDDEDW